MIKTYAHSEDTMWCLLGRYFASAKVRRELGIAMTSDESYFWFAEATPDDGLMGFAGLSINGDIAELRHCYVLPDHRGKGVSSRLLDSRLQYAKESGAKKIQTTIVPEREETFVNLGFSELGRRGKYIRMEKNV